MDATVSTDGASRIVLAREKPFRIGAVEIRPAAREVIGPAARERLQPRVMQVLIALVRARGEILTRDDLIESCWDGRIVGEDALSRVMSKLRRVGEGAGRGAWRLETIPKVGYRLTPEGHDPDAAYPVADPFQPRRVSRRAWVALGASGLAVAVASGATLWLRRPKIPDQARALYERAAHALNSGLPEDNQQAQGFLREAVGLAPDYAQAWGELAYAYQAALLFTDPPRQPGVKAQAEAAARRALELDPNEPQAIATLALLAPVWRSWTATEALYQRALGLHAHDPLVEHVYARLLLGVGRLKEAVTHGLAALKGDEFSVWHHHTLGLGLWSVGRIEEADRLVAKALARWPRHYALWFLQLSLFAYTGRADRAVAMGDDLANRPLNIPFADVELSLLAARALMTRAPSDIQKAVEANLAAAKRGAGYAENAMALVSAVGRLEDAFALAGDLYLDPQLLGAGQRFSTGRFQVASRRQTHHLFMPPTAAMRADPRFPALVRQIGLVDYWRTSGRPPDDTRWLGGPA
jgi:DNA-binding winged helix-turn-helix (wHTH) protein/tetratricopeptide (TPR) repeat protein